MQGIVERKRHILGSSFQLEAKDRNILSDNFNILHISDFPETRKH